MNPEDSKPWEDKPTGPAPKNQQMLVPIDLLWLVGKIKKLIKEVKENDIHRRMDSNAKRKRDCKP
jgi:hypothetical protein